MICVGLWLAAWLDEPISMGISGCEELPWNHDAAAISYDQLWVEDESDLEALYGHSGSAVVNNRGSCTDLWGQYSNHIGSNHYPCIEGMP